MNRKIIFKLFILLTMVSGLVVLIAPNSIKARNLCPESVYEYCWGIGRNVNPDTCECQGCLGLPASDCIERGGTLNTETCQCEYPPGYNCSYDPSICFPYGQCVNGTCQ